MPALRVVAHLDGPVCTHSRVVAEQPPSNTCGPVVEMQLGGYTRTGPKVAVIDVDGLLLNADLTGLYSLGENPVSLFREKLDAAAADPAVAAIVVRINSPGGGVTASDIMRRDLEVFRTRTGRPVVACLLDVGTGGAYYLATASDAILAHPTTITGGIGVILNLYNLREAMGYFNVRSQFIKSGPLIDMGSSAVNLSDEVRQLLQSIADEFHQRFRHTVIQGRPSVDPKEPTTFDGRVFTASQALERRLIDRIGYLDDAVQLARQLAQVPEGPVVVYRRRNDPAYSPYAITPNVPLQGSPMVPFSIPGLDRTRLPSFLYLWQPEATLEKLGGR
ncbi:MAG: S49 family peptidase [Gemmataceae bacterium]|nr:S49 family peptidase [Gemmataceae bacterium]MDW8265369.1 S49 family peptidase [Gemmataceae bacterium]